MAENITKAKLVALEKVFANEIDGALNDGTRLPFQSKAKIYKQLADEGLLYWNEVTLSSRFPVIVKGWELTPLGHLAYCSNC